MAEIQPTILKTLKQITGNTTAKTVSELLPELIAMTEADGAPGAVLYSQSQDLTDEEQALAQANMGVDPSSLGGDNTFCVVFTFTYDTTTNEMTISCDTTISEIEEAYTAGKIVYTKYGGSIFLLSGVDAAENTCSFSNSCDGLMTSIYMAMGDTDWHLRSERYEPKVATVQSSSSSITLDPSANTIYKYGTLSALTISSVPTTGDFVITFTSGSTATVLTVPNDLVMPDGFVVEANTRYEISVSDKYAACMGWPTT